MKRRLFSFAACLLVLGSVRAADKVSFNRDIRPILADTCFKCHGPDEKSRKGAKKLGGLRLDVSDSARLDLGGHAAIVPNHPEKSELIKRITTKDPDDLMPPQDSGKSLTPKQIDLLRCWIAEGAEYQPHWAFIPPVRPSVPQIRKSKFELRNPIDHFILARLEREKLSPSPEADKTTLIRRLSFDLIGLPPTPEEVDAFLADKSPEAYEKLVDRLMALPHYGERMALPWLDAARYADSNGFQQDGDTYQYIWRDWVVNALNANMPFDQFTIEQLAGDLLPKPTLEQKIATGFNRCHLLNGEGGAIAEEQRNVIVFDRVDVTATNWLALTMACSQCHDHKYDPITQRDYYSFFAFFNNVPESGVPSGSGQYRIADPAITVSDEAASARIDVERQKVSELSDKLREIKDKLRESQADWEKATLSNNMVAWRPLDPTEMKAAGGATFAKRDDKSIFVSGTNPDKDTYTITTVSDVKNITGIRIETIPDDSLPAKGAGRASSGNAVLTEFRVSIGSATIKLKSAMADYSQGGFSAEGAIDGKTETGWAFFPDTAKPHSITFVADKPIADGAALTLTMEFQSQHPQHQLGRFRIAATDANDPLGKTGVPQNIREILAVAPDKRKSAQKKELSDFYFATFPEFNDAKKKVDAAQKKLDEAKALQPRVMVMSDSRPRQTRILKRGNYELPLDEVSANAPASLPPMPSAEAGKPQNRLGLARWLVHAENPLTARVQVNRYWQHFFGRGLVKTSENFGIQSDSPSHPELLDWLAVEFREGAHSADAQGKAWNMKAIHKLIVMSATYRQSSKANPKLLERDPENRFYSRGARFRLPSLLLRDVALATSGLLNPAMGGKPVYPYQPKDIWDGLAITKERDFTYPQSKGADLYRRSLYTFWRRTVAPGNMFDASVRNTCKVRPSLTSTPLHALTMLNDVTWVEASRALAEREMKAQSKSPIKDKTDAVLSAAFRRVCSRPPAPEDLKILRRSYDRALAAFRADLKSAEAYLKIGDSPRDAALDPIEHAAYATVCLTIFNLDEAMTKE